MVYYRRRRRYYRRRPYRRYRKYRRYFSEGGAGSRYRAPAYLDRLSALSSQDIPMTSKSTASINLANYIVTSRSVTKALSKTLKIKQSYKPKLEDFPTWDQTTRISWSNIEAYTGEERKKRTQLIYKLKSIIRMTPVTTKEQLDKLIVNVKQQCDILAFTDNQILEAVLLWTKSIPKLQTILYYIQEGDNQNIAKTMFTLLKQANEQIHTYYTARSIADVPVTVNN